LSFTTPSVPHARIFSYGAVTTFLLIMVLGLSHPYRPGPTDSANRMMLQVLPLAMFYFAMKFVPLLSRERQ
jgi:hypothetical protein